jgi:hypothetical protein
VRLRLPRVSGVSAGPDGEDALTINSAQPGFSARVFAYAYWSIDHFAVWVGCDGQNSGGLMRIRALIVACLIAAASLLIATPAEAAPATVYIYKVYYNSPGSDTGSNSKS